MSRKLVTFIMLAFVLASAGTVRAEGFADSLDYSSVPEFKSNWATYGQEPWATSVGGGTATLSSNAWSWFTPGYDPNSRSGYVRNTVVNGSWTASTAFDDPYDPDYGVKIFLTALTTTYEANIFLTTSLGGGPSTLLYGVGNNLVLSSVVPTAGLGELHISGDGSIVDFWYGDTLLGQQALVDSGLHGVAIGVGGLPEFSFDAFLSGNSHDTVFTSVSASSGLRSQDPETPGVPDGGSTAAMVIGAGVLLAFGRRYQVLPA